ncbi:MAG: virulence factor SrfB [Planctomycetales bacterium]|nr:virulence factor SrfB [Planctomycetales bacterium]
MQTLFANTGVQILCVPLPSGRRYTTAQIGYGWQFTKCRTTVEDQDESEEPKTESYPYIQWQVIQSNVSKLYLAVDTSLGDPDIGFFCDPTSLAGDFHVRLENLVDLTGQPLVGLPPVDICLRAATATAGEAKPVHLVVDFGNSRTGALLVEMSGEVTQAAEMLPFELFNRYTLDAFNEQGEPESRPNTRWFSSKTRWCNAPYQLPREAAKTEYYRDTVKGLLGKKQVTRERQVTVRPNLFDDFSMIRMGREADDVTQIMHAKGDFRTGVSSPKRYMWADDEAWLEGAFWYMADPHDRLGTGTFSGKLQGSLLRFLHEDDRDFLLEKADPPEELFASEVPVKPRHAPRSLMVTAIYELLCQAYMYVNSAAYRSRTTDPARSREVRSLTMTFPSGMFQPERERFHKQCEKAIKIFGRTLGKQQKVQPTLTLSIDEASAVHLTYIWSELRMLGQDPRLWFSTISRDIGPPKAAPVAELGAEESAAEEEVGAAPAGRRRSRARIRRPGQSAAGDGAEAGADMRGREMRIACIDIGGGTTDLMIAKYTYSPGIDDSIHGQVLHQDGVSVAGDQLVKRLLERIIVPKFADAIGLEDEDTLLLFGPEVPKNRGFSSYRIDWVNRLLVPLAEQYLQHAVEGLDEEEITHTDPEVIDPAVIESLEQVCNKVRGPGYYNVHQELGLRCHKDEFEEVVHEVFDDLLFDYCTRIVDHRADIVLLAGQPSKLGYIQRLVDMYTPLPASRIIPMFNHYAGNWYPYQDVKGHAPGMIVDPKSAVVVGAGIEFMARNGMLPQFKFSMRGKQTENTYHWGVITEQTSTIREERVLFFPVEGDTRDEWTEFDTSSQRVIIGRKMSPEEQAAAQPIYFLKTDSGGRIGAINLHVRIRRNKATDKVEEHLELDSVTGEVAGQAAVLGENVHFGWRTIADERYYLDTGGLDNIELDGR